MTHTGLKTIGEIIGYDDAPFVEDGHTEAWNPANAAAGQAAPTIVLAASDLLANDSFNGLYGSSAGLVISGLGNALHVEHLAFDSVGNISFTLEANYNGEAGFDYVVSAPDDTSAVSHITLNVTPVNDVPVVSINYDKAAVYGYGTKGKFVTNNRLGTIVATPKSEQGAPIFQPYLTANGRPIIYSSAGDDVVKTLGALQDTGVRVTAGSLEYINQVDPNTGEYVDYVISYVDDVALYVSAADASYTRHDTPLTDTNGETLKEFTNTGRVLAYDSDGDAVTFNQGPLPLYGRVDYLNADGSFGYTGATYVGQIVDDVTHIGNQYTNVHGRYDESFIDPFTVVVTDSHGASTNVDVNVTHYGPQPNPNVAGSGGKKPIAIDLNGDGFAFTDVDDSNVFFDVNGDGWKRRIAWSNPADGLLAYDKNGDGKITSFDEISFVPYAKDQPTDLAALTKAFDTNQDGVFDARDDKWASFGVWQDANSNGISDVGEFKTMSQMGITSINLTSNGSFQVINGQTVHGLASATKSDGSSLAVADVTLRVKNQTQVTGTNLDGTPNVQVLDLATQQNSQAFTGTDGKDLVFGTDGNDYFSAGADDDVVVDDKGDDVVESGAGSDLIYTGQGNDVVNAGDGNDTVFTGAGNDFVFGGSGDDLLMLEYGNDVAFGGDGNDLIAGGSGNDALSGNAGDDKVFSEDGWDALFGQEGNDELYGGAGNDLLDGGEGNDLLDGGLGIDVMQGGAGDDIYVVDEAGDIVDETVGGGIDGLGGTGDAGGQDTVMTNISHSLGNLIENLTLTGTGNVSGIGNDLNNQLVGNDGNNSLSGGAGDDLLDGGAGADSLSGGTGNDTYVIDNSGDVVFEAAGEGTDTVRSRISYALTDNVENLTLLGTLNVDGTGNTLDNVMTGNAGSNTLRGGAGNDTYVLRQGGGRDTVIDSSGNADSVLVAGNFSAADITFTRSDLDVIVSITSSGDALVLKNWFSNVLGQESADLIESIRFENGSAGLDAAAIHFLLDNHAPTAGGTSGVVRKDAQLQSVGNVLATASDVDLRFDSRQHLNVINPGTYAGSYGSLELAANGSYTYTLNNSAANVQALERNASAVENFSYTVQDNALDNKTVTANLAITVFGSNSAPTAIADAAAVAEDVTPVAVGNVLANDQDVDTGDTLAVVNPSTLHGTYGDLTLAADGSYTYTLNNGAANVQVLGRDAQVKDTFAYSATDGLATSTSSLVMTISGTNDSPVAVADVAAVKEDVMLIATGNVLKNDTDVDAGDTLSVVAPGSIHGTYGDLILAADGSYSYTLNNSAASVQTLGRDAKVTDSFAYSATDGLAVSASHLVVTVSGTNDGPVTVADTAAVKEDITRTATGNVLLNDKDIDAGDNLSVAGSSVGTFQGTYGMLALTTDGSYTYTLNNEAANVQALGRNAQVTDTFAYNATDDLATSASALVVTISGTNDGPVAVADVATVKEDVTVIAVGNVLKNDADADVGDTLTVVSPGVLHGIYGDLTLASDGSYTYSLNNGAANVQALGRNAQVTDTFAYSATDGLATSASRLVVTIKGTNDGPIAVADVALVKEDTSLTAKGNVLSNDKDIDTGDTLSVVASSVGTFHGTYGDLALSADGSYTYTLNNGAANVQALGRDARVTDTFAYSATDGLATSASSLVVTIAGTNDGPVAMVDIVAVKEDVALIATGNVLKNDSDIDVGDTLSVVNPGTLHGTYGDLTLAVDGSYSYKLNNSAANVQALGRSALVTDTFAYSATDDLAASASSFVVTIAGTNDGPVAGSDMASVKEDTTLTAKGNVLSNDKDIDTGDTLSVVASSVGIFHGTFGDLALAADGSYTYTLNNGAANVQSLRGGQQVTDSFAYAATDGLAASSATLLVTVTGTNDAPVVVADVAAVKEDTILTATGNVLTNDSDVDQSTVLKVSTAGTFVGAYGSLVLAANGSYTYTLNNGAAAVQRLGANQTVTDVFNYTATDDDASPSIANSTLTVTITGTNDAPVVASAIATQFGREKQAFTFTVPLATFTDVDNGDVLTYSARAVDVSGNLVPLPSWMVFNAATRTFSGIPGSTAGGSFDFVVTATDISGAAAISRFTLNIADEFAGTGANITTIMGNVSDNVLNGTNLNEVLQGSAGNDMLYGGAGDDILDGGTGADLLYGGDGNDTLKFGADAIWINPIYITNAGSPGNPGSGQNFLILGMNRSLDTFDGGSGTDTLLGTNGNDVIALDDTGPAAKIKDVEVIDAGAGNDVVDLTSQRFSYGDVLIKGGAGNDVILTNSGNDVLQGGDGNDWLDGGAGKAILDGGTGKDTLIDGDAASLLFGGKGNDVLYAGKGADLIAFDQGDGADTVFFSAESTTTGANDTISLGKGIKYADLSLKKSGNDLVLLMPSSAAGASNDSITIKDWYAAAASGQTNKTINRLQVVTVGGDYNASSADKTKNQQVEVFDFGKLVQAFDTARTAKPSTANNPTYSWAMMNNMLDAHLSGSNTSALGGDLAYQYVTQGSLSGIGLDDAQSTLAGGTDWQNLHTRSQVEQGMVKLA